MNSQDSRTTEDFGKIHMGEINFEEKFASGNDRVLG